MSRRSIFLILVPLLLFASAARSNAEELYRSMFVRAAPGKLAELIELTKDRMSYYDKAGETKPFWMRHSQGDHWDLFFLYPVGSFTEYYSAERVANRRQAGGASSEEFEQKWHELVAWHEDLFVEGPALDTVSKTFEGAGFFHVEAFRALPGAQDELYKQREMENVYLGELGRPQNLIFTHTQGAAWDLFTVGAYRDLKHFSESGDIPADKEETAARTAGFKSASDISFYLRSLIAMHRDTLAGRVR